MLTGSYAVTILRKYRYWSIYCQNRASHQTGKKNFMEKLRENLRSPIHVKVRGESNEMGNQVESIA